MTNGKNHKPIIDDAQTSMADVPVIIQVAPSVPRGTVMAKGSEDDPSTTSTASTKASQKESAKQITSLLSNKGIPQRLFAKKGAEQIPRIIFRLFIQGSHRDAKNAQPVNWVRAKGILGKPGTATGVNGDNEDK